MNSFAALQMLLLAASGFAILASLGCSLAAGPLLRYTAGWAPAKRHRALLLLTLSPWVLTLSALASVLLPSRLALSLLFVAGPRRRLLAALDLAAERACDEAAAEHAGDRLRVAETLLAVERRLHGAPSVHSPWVASFGGCSVPSRVEAMLQPPRLWGSCASLYALLATAAASVIAIYDALHHTTESLLAHLSG